MRKFLTLTCCVGLASLVGAAQNNNQNNNNQQGKKKGQQQQQQQQVIAPQTGKKYKQAAPGPHNQNFQQPNTVGNYSAMGKKGKKSQNWQGQGQGQGQGGLNTGANTTKFNKSQNLNANKNLNMNKNLNANKNFKFQKK